MKLDLEKLYIVFKTTPYSSEKDIFSGSPITLKQFATKLKRGLDPNMVAGIFPSKRSAQLVANKYRKKVKSSSVKQRVKAKKIIKGYAIFTSEVMARDKYKINTPPTEIFATKKGALAEIKRWEKRYKKKSDFKIFTYDKSKR